VTISAIAPMTGSYDHLQVALSVSLLASPLKLAGWVCGGNPLRSLPPAPPICGPIYELCGLCDRAANVPGHPQQVPCAARNQAYDCGDSGLNWSGVKVRRGGRSHGLAQMVWDGQFEDAGGSPSPRRFVPESREL